MPFSNIAENGSALTIKDEGLSIATNTKSIDFAGAGVTGSAVGQNVTETIPSGSSGSMAIGDPVTSGTSASVLYVDASGNLAQENVNLSYDDVNNVFFARNLYSPHLKLSDTAADNTLDISADENLSGNRTLRINVNDANRVLTIFADATISGTNTGDQTLAGLGGATKALDNLASVAINAALLLGSSDAFALGSATKMWSDLFLADGAVINFNNGNTTITHSAGLLTSNVDFVVPAEVYGAGWNGSNEVPTKNDVYDKIEAISLGGATPTIITVADEATDTTCFPLFVTAATGDLGPKTNANMTFNSNTGVVTFANAVLTTADINGGTVDGAVIGGASAAAGTFTTIAGTTLTLTDAASITKAGLGLTVTNSTDGSSVQVAIFQGDRATMADNDEAYITLRLSDDGGTQKEAARITWAVPDVNAGTNVDGRLDFSVMTAGSLAKELQLSGLDLSPSTNDGLALGTTSLSFSDLFLASGAVINIANDAVITHSAGIFTVSTGDLRVTTAGTNSASVVTVGGTQTLTSKTLTSPTIGTSPTAAGATWTDLGTVTTADINGGTIDGTVIGGASAAAATITTLIITSFGGNWTNASRTVADMGIVTTIDINGGTLDGTIIGGAAAAAITGTTITVNTNLVPDANDGAGLGISGTAFSDLFLASGALIDFAAGNSVITHSSAVLTVSTGDLRVTTAGTNAASVVTVGGTQTLTSKTLTSPVINTGTIGTSLVATSDDGATLGDATHNFSDLFLASGALINFANANAVITHSSAVLTVSTGDFRVTTAGTNAASVVTVGGTQTLTSKTLTSPTLTTPSAFTTGGVITLAENTSVAYDPAGSADGKYSGITVSGTAGAALVFGDVVYLAAADSRWELADADAAATAGDVMLGIVVLAAAGDGSATNILLHGIIRADARFPALTISAQVYVSTTPGDIVVAQPSGTDDVIRVVGRALTADEIYFDPSEDYITHT